MASHGKSHPSVVRDPAPTASGQSLSSAAAAHSAAFCRIQPHSVAWQQFAQIKIERYAE